MTDLGRQIGERAQAAADPQPADAPCSTRTPHAAHDWRGFAPPDGMRMPPRHCPGVPDSPLINLVEQHGAIDRGSIHTSLGGHLMYRPRAGQNRHCARKVRELQAAGLVDEQLVDGKPQLTAAGRAAIEPPP